MFETLLGNDKIKTYLSKVLREEKIPQSLLFAGPEGVGKSLFASAFAKCIVGTKNALHPDIHNYFPEGKIGIHSIQSMREFSEAVYMAPFQSKRKVFIIHEAHRMLATGANALLKTFEEPALDSVIILLSHAQEKLLPTVLSRCQIIRFQPIPVEVIESYLVTEKKLSSDEAKEAAAKGKGSLGKAALHSSSEHHPLRSALLNLLVQKQQSNYSDIVNCSKEISDQIEARLKAEEAAMLEMLLAAYPEKPGAKVRQMIEKEVEGASSLKKASEAMSLFELLLSWYRDLRLLSVSGNPDLLSNRDFKNQLEGVLQKGGLLPIEKVEEALSQAVLGLERSTPLALIFESLFLRLSLMAREGL